MDIIASSDLVLCGIELYQQECEGVLIRPARSYEYSTTANSIFLFPVDLAIRRVQEAHMLIFGVPSICMHPYPFMKCSALALFGLFRHFFHLGCLDPGQRCDAGLDRDCSVCWLHKWFQGLHVCISPITAVHPTPISPPPVFVCYSCCYLHFKIRRSPYHCCHYTLNQPGLFRFCVFDVDMKIQYTQVTKSAESKSPKMLEQIRWEVCP